MGEVCSNATPSISGLRTDRGWLVGGEARRGGGLPNLQRHGQVREVLLARCSSGCRPYTLVDSRRVLASASPRNAERGASSRGRLFAGRDGDRSGGDGRSA